MIGLATRLLANAASFVVMRLIGAVAFGAEGIARYSMAAGKMSADSIASREGSR